MDELNNMSIYDAIDAGDIEMVNHIIRINGGDLFTIKKDNKYPLGYACSKQNSEIVKILLDAGADANSVDKNNHTPLYISVHKRKYRHIDLLIEYGADINYDTYRNSTKIASEYPLLSLVTRNLLSWEDANEPFRIMDMLFRRGLDIRKSKYPYIGEIIDLPYMEKSRDDMTKIKAVKYLLKKGANPRLEILYEELGNYELKRPIDVAKAHGWPYLADLIAKYMKKKRFITN